MYHKQNFHPFAHFKTISIKYLLRKPSSGENFFIENELKNKPKKCLNTFNQPSIKLSFPSPAPQFNLGQHFELQHSG